MNKTKSQRIIASIFISVWILTGCSNTPQNVDYYTLSYPLGHSIGVEKSKRLVLIESIVLAEYLRQQGLVMQSNQNKMQFSQQHRWAEKLDESILRVLLANLENQRQDFRFESFKGRWKSEPVYRLNVEITHFHVLENNNTLVAGQYWLFDSQNQLLNKSRFDIRKSLSQDGYLNAVEQMNISLVSLAAQISQTLP